MAPTARIALLVLARPTFDIPLAEAKTDALRTQLASAGFEVVSADGLIMDMTAAEAAVPVAARNDVDLVLVFQATFADSTMLTRLAESAVAPLVLWAVPETATGGRLRLNSLCGINLGAHALTLRGIGYDHIYAAPDDVAALARLETLGRAARVARRLRHTTLGIVGDHPAGMDSCHLDTALLHDALGVDVVQYPVTTLFERMATVPEPDVNATLAAVGERVSGLDDVDQAPLRGTLRAYHALEGLRTDPAHATLDALAVRCWPEVFETQGCAVCGAMSLLCDRSVPAACEADANGAITQLILQEIAGAPAFDVDLVAFDPDDDSAVVWHCGKAPLSMADPDHGAQASIHSNRRVPLVMAFPLRPGPVTFARLSRATGALRLVIAAGTMLRRPPSFDGTSGVVRFGRPAADVLQTLLDEGLEHHLALAYGDHVAVLEALAARLNLPVLHLG